MIFQAILDHQRRQNYVGAVAKIGVFYGRSFALMAKCVNPANEKALGLDLFDIGVDSAGVSSQQVYIERVLKAEGLWEQSILQPGSSMDLTLSLR